MFDYFIGIDVSKDSFDYSILSKELKVLSCSKFPMNREGFEQLKDVLSMYKNKIIGMESTGSYHVNLLAFLMTFNEHVCLVNPMLIQRFSQSISLRKTKTDRIDSKIIAKFLCKNMDKHHLFQPKDMASLSAIARLRESITRDIAKTKTQLKQQINVAFPELLTEFNIFTDSMLAFVEAVPSAQKAKHEGIKKLNEIIAQCKKQRGRKTKLNATFIYTLAEKSIGTADELTQEVIKFHVQKLTFLKQKLSQIDEKFIKNIKEQFPDEVDILQSIDGIGETTSAHFMAEVGNINRFQNYKKLIAFAGSDPTIKESGLSSRNGKISKRGTPRLRRIGFIMATCVIRANKIFNEYYQAKREQGFPYKKAVIATMNKLFKIIFALLNKNQKFNPDFNSL